MINITSADDGVYADLTIDLMLKWDFEESKALGLDLGVLLAGVGDATVEQFKKAIVPPPGAAVIEVKGGLILTLALGIEYNDQTKRVTPYIIGSTGLEAFLSSGAEIAFEAALGPLTGSVTADFQAGSVDSPLKLQSKGQKRLIWLGSLPFLISSFPYLSWTGRLNSILPVGPSRWGVD